MRDAVDALVVGAGVAGLSAAVQLHRAGLTVRVQESRPRVGGRLLTATTSGGDPVDLGATWFWPGEVRVAALIDELGLATHPQHLTGDAVYHDPSGRIRLEGNPIDVPSGRFSGGAAALTDGLAHRLPPGALHLDDPVVAIASRGDAAVDRAGLRVTTARGMIEAHHVVLALPPALAVERIEIEPALPARLAGLAATTPVWMGSVAKVVAVYAEPFWRDRGLAGAGISHLGPLGELHDMSGPDGRPAALFGFARLASPTDPAPDREAIEAQLQLLFGPGPDPVEVIVADWRQPDTTPVGQRPSTAYQLFGHPLYAEPALDGRLHWASTETVTISPGHIEGALAGAERAVAAILAHRRPIGPPAGDQEPSSTPTPN